MYIYFYTVYCLILAAFALCMNGTIQHVFFQTLLFYSRLWFWDSSMFIHEAVFYLFDCCIALLCKNIPHWIMFSTAHGLFCSRARVLEFLYCINLGVEWPNHRVWTWLVLLGDDNCLPEWLCQDILRGCMKLTVAWQHLVWSYFSHFACLMGMKSFIMCF